MTRTAYFERLKPEFRADHCKKCGKCMKACPQHIQIPDMLAKAHQEMSAAMQEIKQTKQKSPG